MTGTVQVHCERCGPLTMPIVDLHVRCCLDNHDDASYAFRCRYCDWINVKQIHPKVRDLLFAHPLIRVEWWSVPKEIAEHPEVSPPLTLEDLLDFARELEQL